MHGRSRSRTSKEEPSWLKAEKVEEDKSEAPEKEPDQEPEATERTALTTKEEEEEDELVVVHRGPLLQFFVGVSALSIIAALLLAAAHAASIYSYSTRRRDYETRGPVDVALRAYGLVFCGAIVFVELELGSTTRSSIVSRFWTLRGLFYAFVGLLAMDNANFDDRRREAHKVPEAWTGSMVPYSIYLKSTAASLLALGIIYILLGLCWCKRLKESRLADYKKQLAEATVINAERLENNNDPRHRHDDDDTDDKTEASAKGEASNVGGAKVKGADLV